MTFRTAIATPFGFALLTGCDVYTCLDLANCASPPSDAGSTTDANTEVHALSSSETVDVTSVPDGSSGLRPSAPAPATNTTPDPTRSEAIGSETTSAPADTESTEFPTTSTALEPSSSTAPSLDTATEPGEPPCENCDAGTTAACPQEFDAAPTVAGQFPPSGTYTGSATAIASLRPKLKWSAVEGRCSAVSYRIQLDNSCLPGLMPSCTFPSPEVDTTTTESAYTPSESLAVSQTAPVGAQYAWRVQACDPVGCGPWSEARYLNVGRTIDDVNGDGFGDVVVEGRYGDVVAPADGLVFIGGNANASSVAIKRELNLSGAKVSWDHARFVGDLNGDGYADLMLGRFDQYKTTDGSSDWPPTVPMVVYGGEWPTLEAAALAHLDVDLTSVPYHAGDVDGDGLADVLLIDTTRGAGSFRVIAGGSALTTTLEEGPVWYANGVGDMTGDGLVDVVTCQTDGSNESTWLRSPGRGTAVLEQLDCATPFTAGDFNNDGHDDLVRVDLTTIHLHLWPLTSTPDWSWDSGLYGIIPLFGLNPLASSTPTLVFASEGAAVLRFENPLPASPTDSFSSNLIQGRATSTDLDGDGSQELISGTEDGVYWTRTANLFGISNTLPIPVAFEPAGIVTP